MTDKNWEIINKKVEERPLLQDYEDPSELPPIPISFPQKGAAGNTGAWRTYRPVIDHEKCTKCGRCYLFCPDGVVEWDTEKEEFTIDLAYCKGCEMCAVMCPVHCIEMVLEEK